MTNRANRKRAAAWAIGLALVASACERLEPEPETDVVFQAVGRLTSGAQTSDAVLLVRARFTGLVVEVREAATFALRLSGLMALGSLDLSELRGPLAAELEDRDHDGEPERLSVIQRIRRVTAVSAVSGSAARGATRAEFERSGSRWMWFSGGYLEHGSSGSVTLTLRDAAGASAGRFEGLTTTHPERVAVATEVTGALTGDSGLGGGRPAKMTLTLPYGAGAIDTRDGWGNVWRQRFAFDPASDLTEPTGELRELTSGPDYVEVDDTFRSGLRVRRVDLGGDRAASATGSVLYSVVVAVNREKILVQGDESISATLTRDDGRRATFTGSGRIDREISW